MRYFIAATLCCSLGGLTADAGLLMKPTSGGSTGVPVNTTAPTLSGTAAVGATLTCSGDTWTNSPTSFSRNFLRDGTTSVQSGASTTYVVVSGDAGHTLLCVVTATNGSGSTPSPNSNSISIPGGAVFSKVNENFNSGSANQTGLTVNIGTAVAGDLFVIMLRGFNTAGTPMSATTITTTPSSGISCAHTSGTFSTSGSADLDPYTDIWHCVSTTASGSITFNAAYTSSGALPGNTNTPSMLVGEFNGNTTVAGVDAGVGAIFSNNAFTGTLSLSTSSAIPQSGDLVVSLNAPNTSNPTAIGGNQLDFVTDATKNFTYQLITSGTVTHTYTFGGSAQMLSGSIAAFKHP